MRADFTFVVGHPSMKGLHALARTLFELAELGVHPDHLVPVFNQTPRSPRLRGGYSQALRELTGWRTDTSPSAVFIPERPVDDALRANLRLPTALSRPLTSTLLALNERSKHSLDTRPNGLASPAPTLVKPGSLRALLDLDDEGELS